MAVSPGCGVGSKAHGQWVATHGAYEVLNWATKFFADVLMRHDAVQTKRLGAPSNVSVLA